MGRRLALLIATQEHDDPALRRLTAPAADVEALAAVLRDPRIAGFEVDVLIDEPHHRVGEAIGALYSDRRRDDLTLLYFTGHGLKDDDGRLYLATSNTRRNSLLFTSLPAEQLDQALEGCASRQKVVVLDCCYSGAFPAGRGIKAAGDVHVLERLQGTGRVVLTASDAAQYSFEGDRVHGSATQSVFTRHLVDGLREGTADLDGDGDITVDELYSYVHDRVVEEMPQQRPKKKSDVQGHIVIARNVARPPAPPGRPQPLEDPPGIEPAPEPVREPGRPRRRPALVAGALALGTATGLIIASTLVPDGAAGGGNEPPPAGEPVIGTISAIGAITVGPDPGGIDFFADRDGGRRAAVAVGVGLTLVETTNDVVDETLDLERRGADIAVALGNSRTCVATDEGLVVLDSNPSTPRVLGVVLDGEEVQSVVAAPDGDRVYATTPSGVAAVDVRTGAVTPIDDEAGRKPGLEVSPDGARIYVVNADRNLVSVIDPATATTERTIATGPFTLDVALSPTGPTGYVAQASAVGVFATDGTTPAFTTIPVPGGDVVQAVAVTPDGRRVLAVTRGGGRVVEIDAGTRTVTRTSEPDGAVTAADIAVTDTHAYVSDRASGRLIVFDISDG